MTDTLKPMDVYATHLVSFDLAAYCRGHKFSPAAVELTKALHNYKMKKNMALAADLALEQAQNNLSAALEAVRVKMENDPHA